MFLYKNNGPKHSQKVKEYGKNKTVCLEYYVIFLKFYVLLCYIYTRYSELSLSRLPSISNISLCRTKCSVP